MDKVCSKRIAWEPFEKESIVSKEKITKGELQKEHAKMSIVQRI